MAGWKSSIQVSDLDENQKLELFCIRCHRLTYTDKKSICVKPERAQLFLDEVEARARCKLKSCKGHMRLAMSGTHKMSGFVGGLA